jgi:predicted NACHT family NTPase
LLWFNIQNQNRLESRNRYKLFVLLVEILLYLQFLKKNCLGTTRVRIIAMAEVLQAQEYDYVLKVSVAKSFRLSYGLFCFQLMLTGAPGAGKTSFLLRYVDNTYYEGYLTTIGVEMVSFNEEDNLK